MTAYPQGQTGCMEINNAPSITSYLIVCSNVILAEVMQ
jgi:hypothetical protein